MKRKDILEIPSCCCQTALSGSKAKSCPTCGRKITDQIRDKAPLIEKYKNGGQ